MNATTLDGSVGGPDGRSRSISSPADRAAMREVRRLCDAIVIGGATLRAERYRPVHAADPEGRRLAGVTAAPVLVVISGSCDLPWEEPVFTESTMSPLVVTLSSADADKRARAAELCDVVTLDVLDFRDVIRTLAERGLRRIACEAGPRLVAQMIDQDTVDELDITFAPALAGRASPGGLITNPHRWRLVEHWTIDGFLFTRYLAN